MKLFWLLTASVVALVIFSIQAGHTPADTAVTQPSGSGENVWSSTSRISDSITAHGMSPFAKPICLSSDCATDAELQTSEDLRPLPARTAMSSLLHRLSQGDKEAVGALGAVLDSCANNHRNRLLIQRAWGMIRSEEANECSADELRDLLSNADHAVANAYKAAPQTDEAWKATRVLWLFHKAQLEDFLLGLNELPDLRPDVNGTVHFDDLPAPRRRSAYWEEFEIFAAAHLPASENMVPSTELSRANELAD